MLPVNEGDRECLLCSDFDLCLGCVHTYSEKWRDQFPPCGRSLIVTKEGLEKIIKEEVEKNGKRGIFKFMQRNRG